MAENIVVDYKRIVVRTEFQTGLPDIMIQLCQIILKYCFLFTCFFLLNLPVSAQQIPTPKDLLEFEDPVSMDLSSDGKHILLQTKRAVIDSNDYGRTSWLISTVKKQSTQQLDLPSGARSLTWFPDREQFAYLAPTKQGKQVYAKKIGSEPAQQITHQKRGVRSFAISPNGDRIAYTSSVPPAKEELQEAKSKNDREGVEIDLETFSIDNILRDRLSSSSMQRSKMQLVVSDLNSENKKIITDTLWIEDYRWAPSGRQIAISAKPRKVLASSITAFRADLYLFEFKNDNMRTLKKGKSNDKYIKSAVSYSSPFWSPNGNRLGFVRTEHVRFPLETKEVKILDVKNDRIEHLATWESRNIGTSFQWIKPNEIYVNHIDKAKRQLSSLSSENGEMKSLYNTTQSSFGYSFDKKGEQVVWIEESVNQPPEVFKDNLSFQNPQQLSNLNGKYNHIWLPEVEEIHWESNDGKKIQGWLIKSRQTSSQSASPLLTLVHGGPGTPGQNRFHPMGSWLYPLQIYAARGYAIFIPNYRGTNSFGKNFLVPQAVDQEPVQDIVAGIKHLINEGIADENSLGIMGHSHGAWLAPMVAAEYPNFLAGSFAEGGGNMLSNYEQSPGFLNRINHEQVVTNGKTPYQHTERYLELSPVFREQFTKNTPSLFEFGQDNLAVQGLEYGKALWRQGTPHKLIIYPNTGHNIREPQKHIESMERNLQWFEKWMEK